LIVGSIQEITTVHNLLAANKWNF